MTTLWPMNGKAGLGPALGALAVSAIALVFAGGGDVRAQTFESLPPVPGAQSEDGFRNDTYGTSGADRYRGDDAYRPGRSVARNDVYSPENQYPQNDAYRPSDGSYGGTQGGYDPDSVYNRGPDAYGGQDRREPPAYDRGGYDDRGYDDRSGGRDSYRYDDRYQDPPPPYREDYAGPDRGAPTYSQGEILDAGHSFFGSVSKGLASVVEYAFRSQGAPTGYILGEDAGGAFVAGLRYGEGTLYSRRFPPQKVFWQGPSLGYDFGAEGSKTMVLVYNMDDPSQIYERFGGVQGSAYLVGGVSIQFQKRGDVTLAPIRSGLGVRLGANVGYLKYTRSPTWNPF